jgi:hypothetical protein
MLDLRRIHALFLDRMFHLVANVGSRKPGANRGGM